VGQFENPREDDRENPEMNIYIGTAGWTIPRDSALRFSGTGSHLERYARVFNAVEINSTFHRSHLRSTYGRWAAISPEGFRFAVKAPREITHASRLINVRDPLARFVEEAGGLGSALGPVLFQLPPSLAFDAAVAANFFELLRDLYSGGCVLEPRHPSWFGQGAEDILKEFRVARVAADPARIPLAGEPAGWKSLVYFRLHGTPRVYYSAYSARFLQQLAARISALAQSATVWCIFDNTAAGAATANALTLLEAVTTAARSQQGGGRSGWGKANLPTSHRADDARRRTQ
jgi:uncharacterized protein YecE (DUF72 family)